MTILKFSGPVVNFTYTTPRFWGGHEVCTPTIGGVDILEEIEAVTFGGRVTVALADERFDGELFASGAFPGFSEYTPAEPAELTIGPHNLIAVLRRHEGQSITLWIADEPINVLD